MQREKARKNSKCYNGVAGDTIVLEIYTNKYLCCFIYVYADIHAGKFPSSVCWKDLEAMTPWCSNEHTEFSFLDDGIY